MLEQFNLQGLTLHPKAFFVSSSQPGSNISLLSHTTHSKTTLIVSLNEVLNTQTKKHAARAPFKKRARSARDLIIKHRYIYIWLVSCRWLWITSLQRTTASAWILSRALYACSAHDCSRNQQLV